MDRIQGRHLWDDGRYGGSNIYDGIGPNNEGLNGIFRGPRGILVTRMLENGMRKNIIKLMNLSADHKMLLLEDFIGRLGLSRRASC